MYKKLTSSVRHGAVHAAVLLLVIGGATTHVLCAGERPDDGQDTARPISEQDLKEAAANIRAEHAAGGREMWDALAALVKPGMTVVQMKTVLPPARAGAGDAPREVVLFNGASFMISYALDAQFGVEASGIAKGKVQEQMVLATSPRIKSLKDIPHIAVKTKDAAAGADLPSWAKTVAEALPRFEVTECDAAPNVKVGPLRGYRMVLRNAEPGWDGSGPQGAAEPASGTVRQNNSPEFVTHVELVVFPTTADLPERLAERIPWQKLPQTWHARAVDMGEGSGFRWFARTTLYWQEWLREKLKLKGGDDRLALLADGLYVQDKGSNTANSVMGPLKQAGEKTVPYIEAAIKRHGGEDAWKAVHALGYIQGDRATVALKSLYASNKERVSQAAAYALIHEPYRKAAREEYFDILRRQTYVYQAAAACVKFEWREAIPLLQAVCDKPAHWGHYRDALKARRTLENRPIARAIEDAEAAIVGTAHRPLPTDEQTIAQAKKVLLDSSDTEAVRIAAIGLAIFDTKANKEQVQRVQQAGREILKKLPADDTKKLLRTLVDGMKAHGQAEGYWRECADLLEWLGSDSESTIGAWGTEQTWGEPVEGVQVALHAEKLNWQTGEIPKFTSETRKGERKIVFGWGDAICELEFDGRWYYLAIDDHPVDRIRLDDPWKDKETHAKLPLSPGKHTIRVAITGPVDGKSVRAVSNRVEFVIERALPGSTRAIEHEMARSEFAFAAVCEAAGSGTVVQVIDDGGTAPNPVYETVQEYNVGEVLAGKTPPERAVKLQYSHQDAERCRERAVTKGECVIWLVCRFDHIEGKWYGVKAIADIPENRKAIAAAESVQGEAVNGLKCSIGVQENSLRVGDEIRIDARFENVSDKPISFPYPPDYAARLMLMRDEKGQAVESRMTGITEGWMHNKPFRTLQPGESSAVTFTGKIAFRPTLPRRTAQPEPALSIDFRQDAMLFTLQVPGSFTVALRLASDEEAAARLRKQGLDTVWQGAVSSNVARFEVKAATRAELDAAIETLRGEAEGKRRESIRLLRAHMDTKAVPALMEIVLKGPPELKADAAAALGAIGDSSIVPALVAEYRKAGSVQDRQLILGIIEAASDWTQQWPLYLEIARSGGSHEETSLACSRLADLGRPEVVPVLIERAKSGAPMIQRGAIGQIAQMLEFHAKKLPGQAIVGLKDELIGILKRDRDGSVRSRAATALAKAGGEDVAPALLEALKDPDAFVGSYAAHSLGRIASPEAIPALEAYSQTAPRESQKRAAQEAIERIRERAKAASQPARQPSTGSPAQPGAAVAAPDAKAAGEDGQAEELCELEIDGRRYRCAGDIDVKSSWFPSGRRYKGILIDLNGQWKCGDEPLVLKSGKHSVRVWFVANPTEKDAGKPVRFATNSVEIVPDDNLAVDSLKELGWKPMEKGNLVWDSNGRVSSIDLFGPSRDVPVTDAWLVHLKGMTELRFLFLADTQVTDAGLVHLRNLTNLRELRLQKTRIGDAGLAHLRGLAKLEWLELTGTQVTDAGLAHLAQMADLKSLFLNSTRVTDEGVEELRRMLPNLKVFFGEGSDQDRQMLRAEPEEAASQSATDGSEQRELTIGELVAARPAPDLDRLPGSGLSIEEATRRPSAFVIVCEAIDTAERMYVSGIHDTSVMRQQFRTISVLADNHAPTSQSFLSYVVKGDPPQRERPIRKGDCVIWIGDNPEPDAYRGLKALADRPENRKAVWDALAARVKPGMSVAQMKIVLPPRGVHTMDVTGGGFGIRYRLDESDEGFDAVASGAWDGAKPDDPDDKLILNAPVRIEKTQLRMPNMLRNPKITINHQVAWSEPVGGLAAALVVPRTTIPADGFFEILLSLRNTGSKAIAIQSDNPFAFDLDVKDEEGDSVPPTWMRADIWSPPARWVRLAPNAMTSFKVCFEHKDGTGEGNLDSITETWKLKPGKYRLTATYKSDNFSRMTTTKPPVEPWKGELRIPAVSVLVEEPAVTSRQALERAARKTRQEHPDGGRAMWEALASPVKPGMTVAQMKAVLPPAAPKTDDDPREAMVFDGASFTIWYPLDTEFGVEATGTAKGKGPDQMVLSAAPQIKKLADMPSIRARRAGAVMPDDTRPEAEAAGVEGNASDAEISRLIRQLESDDVESRRNAARQLQEQGPRAKAALPALVQALEDTDGLVCHHAARAIGQIGPLQDDVIAALVRALGELKGARAFVTKVAELSTGLEAVSEVLLKIGEPAVPHLARALSTEKQPLTGRTLSLLESMGPKARAATSAVVHVLEGANTDAHTRSQAVSVLGRIGTADKVVVPALIRALDDPSWYVRRDTARALGQIGWPGGEPAVPVLSKAMTGEHYDVQLAAAEALGRMAAKSDKALAPLLLVIRDRNLSEHVREDALQGLGQMGPAAEKTLPDLIAAVDDDSSNVRFRAAEVIAGLGPRASSAVPALRGRLKDVQWPVRREAARALGCIGPSARSAEAALTAATRDDMPQVRDAAREALERIRVPPLESRADAPLELDIAQLLAPLQRNPWSQWSPGAEVVREFVDDQREGSYAYTQPDLTYGLAQDGKKLVRIQEVDGKPVEQVFDTSDQTGLVPSAFIYRVGKGVPAQLRIDDVDVDCLRFEDTLVEHIAGGVHITVYREWVLPTYPTVPLRRETNDNWWRVKSLRNTRRIGDRELSCVVVESHMKEAGGHARETQYLSAEVPGHLVESVKEIHSKGNDKPLLIHERVAAIRNETKALSSTRPTSEVEVAETDVPEHLQHWPGLADRVGGKIVDAPAEDVKVAKGYVAFADKGKIHNVRRVTIMTAKQQYAVGEEVRVIHVLEAVEPGDKVYVMGPKTVFGECVDGKDVTKGIPKPHGYDGRVLASPAVDYNYAITKYTFNTPGEHTIQWRAAGPFDEEGLASNVLKIVVAQAGEAGGAPGHPEQSRADTVLPGSRLSIEEAVGRWAAFAVACEAVEEPEDSAFAHVVPGSVGKRHQYRWDVDLGGGRNAGGQRILNYRVWDIGQQHERPIAKGQRVIWIGVNPAPDHYRGVKALPDTPENREAVRAAFANRPASADKYVAFPERTDAEGAAERVALLKRSLDTFRFVFRARLEPERPTRFLALRVAGGEDSSDWEKPAVRITRQQATRIIDHLAAEGLFFRRAGNVIKDAAFEPDTAVDTLWLIDDENDPQTVLVEELQYGDTRRLDALREVLEGEARAAADKLLALLESNGQQKDDGDNRSRPQDALPDSSRAPSSETTERLRTSLSPLKLLASNVKYEGEALPKPPDDVTGEKIADNNVAYYRSVKANGLVAEDPTANTARAYCMFDLAIAAGWYERKGSEYLPQDIRGLYRQGTGLWMGSNGVGILVYDMKSKVWSRHSVQQKAVPGFHVTVLYGDADYVFATYGYSQEVPNAEPSLHVYSTTHGAWLRITTIPRRDALRLGTSERLRVARGWNHRRYAEQPLVPIGGEETPELAYPDKITRRPDGSYLLRSGDPNVESSWTDLVVHPADLQAAFERLTPLSIADPPATPATSEIPAAERKPAAVSLTKIWANKELVHQRGERTQVEWYGPLPQLELQTQTQ